MPAAHTHALRLALCARVLIHLDAGELPGPAFNHAFDDLEVKPDDEVGFVESIFQSVETTALAFVTADPAVAIAFVRRAIDHFRRLDGWPVEAATS